MCGGTIPADVDACVFRGLSPRVRGNHHVIGERNRAQGSIPARAGEPRSPIRRRQGFGVYPRACGGTAGGWWTAAVRWGLSPRVRGNLQHIGLGPPLPRSIPARAGEPASSNSSPTGWRVYPRACGGTVDAAGAKAEITGLSPRVRGNPVVEIAGHHQRRSIPARAGEPQTNQPPGRPGGVYPRTCGGTVRLQARTRLNAGLSPRVRGNQQRIGQDVGVVGSIPARAGEPYLRRRHRPLRRVYPRACGGTPPPGHLPGTVPGLSPRVRGNRRR